MELPFEGMSMMSLKYMKSEYLSKDHYTYYFEIDHEGTAFRQITVINERAIVSNRPYKDEHFCLSEMKVDFVPEDEISKQEFEAKWQKDNQLNMDNWELTKKNKNIGTVVEGTIECIYPQGIILNLLDEIYGVVDYDKCYEKSGSDKINVMNKVRGVVSGFDENNLWVIIDDGEIILDVQSKK